MFGRIVQATFRGLLQWPDLMVFGLLSFGLSLLLDAIFSPLWIQNAQAALEAQSSLLPLPAVGLLLVQQVLLTVGSMLIAVAATRIALARLRGQQMSLRDSLRFGSLLRPTLTYSLVYALVSGLLSAVYLYILFGGTGIGFGAMTTTTGISGLTQVPTANAGGIAGLIVVVFVPILLVWSLANMLVAPVIAAEQRGGFAAVLRSWLLVRRTILVVVGLVASAFGFACVLSMFMAFFVVSSGDVMTMETAPVLPELPVVLTAFLTALVFMIGAIFNAAWYLVATEEDASADVTAQ